MSCMLCQAISEEEFENMDLSNWYANTKEDGERCIIIKNNDRIEIINRRGREKSIQYPEIVEEVAKVSGNFCIDGEMCSKEGGFNNLQKRALLTDRNKIEKRIKEIPVIFFVFDIISFNNKNLTQLPLIERKDYLEKFRGLENVEVLNWFENEDIKELWNWVKKNDKEGIILKLKNSMYKSKRDKSWLKLKNFKERIIEFVYYDLNPAGIKLTSENYLYEVQVAGIERAKKIKERLDKGEKVLVNVQYLEETKVGKLRFPSTKEVLI